MNAFLRLLRLGSTVKERTLPIWKVVVVHLALGQQWLMHKRRTVFWSAGISIVVALLIGFMIGGGASWYGKYHDTVAPLLTLAAGVAVAGVALVRHFAQTDADRQRRITESFAKAVEQLGSDKLEVRLGGIYSLERISKESLNDYWTVMEILTAFVRERSHQNDAEHLEQRVSRHAYFLWQEAGRPDGRADEFWATAVALEEFGELQTDVAAVLTVVTRRSEREREGTNKWQLDFSGALLNGANLSGAHLEGANFLHAHVNGADFQGSHLEGAYFVGAQLKGAYFLDAHLEGASLRGAHLQAAVLGNANLKGAHLWEAKLESALLPGANLEGADFSRAHLKRAILDGANLKGATLDGANLEGAILCDAHLEGASLSGAHLVEGADLSRASLEGANFSGAHLDGAIIVDRVGLSEEQLRDAASQAAVNGLSRRIIRFGSGPPVIIRSG
jgi:uncharacterized protein YjbI with pentapeptide repeats